MAVTSIAILVVGPGAWAYVGSPATGRGSSVVTRPSVGVQILLAPDDLYPGTSEPIRIRVNNRESSHFLISSIVVLPQFSSRAGCPVGEVTTEFDNGPPIVAAGSSVEVGGRISLLSIASNDCQGATFGLDVTVKGMFAK